MAEIDDDLADTAAFTDAYAVPPEASANCVVVAARRAGQTTLAACVVLATTRADVNGLVRRHLGARKASFAPQDVAVAESGMAYGGITPVGPARGLAGARRRRRRGRRLGRHRVGHPGQQAGRAGLRCSPRCRPPWCSRAWASRWPRPTARHRQPRRRERAPDDSDVGWGERAAEADDTDRRYLEDRPPHWGSD